MAWLKSLKSSLPVRSTRRPNDCRQSIPKEHTGADHALCDSCEQLDLEAIFSDMRVYDNEKGIEVGTRTFPDSISEILCPLCRLFFEIRQESADDHRMPPGCYQVLATFYARACGALPFSMTFGKSKTFVWAQTGDICLVVTNKTRRYLENEQERISRPGVLLAESGNRTPQALSAADGRINWKLLRGLMSDCKTQHGDACNTTTARFSHLIIGSLELSLIDCRRRKIVAYRDGDEYAALSYVWGQSSVKESSSDRKPGLPAVLPLVILDAMKATISLSLRYLWVDKYCIDQNDQLRKAMQIDAMGLIYWNATITLVDGSGEDETSGLARVSVDQGSRRDHMLRKSSITLFSVPGATLLDLRNTRWATRGWTYQEGVLSRRRLVFTKSQVYFECEQGFQFEMKQIRWLKKCPGFINRGYSNTSKIFDQHNNSAIWDHIDAFNRRELRFESDRLRALAGCLNSFGQHLYGLPFTNKGDVVMYSLLHKSATPQSLHLQPQVLESLAWTGQFQGRRTGFPSFTWTAWMGGKINQYVSHQYHRCYQAEVQNLLNKVTSVETEPPGLLRIKGRIDQVSLSKGPTDSTFLCLCSSFQRLNPDTTEKIKALDLSEEATQAGQIEGACLWLFHEYRDPRSRYWNRYVGLLLKTVENGYERAGLLEYEPSGLLDYYDATLASTKWETVDIV